MPKTQIFILIFAVMALVGLDYLHAAWTAPTGNPPSNNIATPINTGGASQTKSGALGAGALSVTGDSQFNGDMIFRFYNTTAGNAETMWRMRRNDGTGNFNVYLNSSGGSTPTHATAGHANKEVYNPGDGTYRFLGSNASAPAGTPISWHALLNIFANGRIGADQYCDINGNNCVAAEDVTPLGACQLQYRYIFDGDTTTPWQSIALDGASHTGAFSGRVISNVDDECNAGLGCGMQMRTVCN